MNNAYNCTSEVIRTSFASPKKLQPKDVVLLKGFGNYTWVYLSNGSKVLFAKTMHTILESFQNVSFVRIHKSYCVNLNFIKSQVNKEELTLVMSNGITAEVSRRKKKEFLSLINYNKI